MRLGLLSILLEFENPNFEFERECCSVIDSNISSKLSTLHLNVSDFLAVVAKDGTGPNAIGRIVSHSLTVFAKIRMGHRSGSVKSSDVLRHYSGR